MPNQKWIEFFVIKGKVEVPVADKNGKYIGSTDLLLENVMIKAPKKELFGYLTKKDIKYAK